MNGFAPLVEGFLAFALTMLAMTMGVSSIVGALHRLRRRHARGLRDMVRLLYHRDIVPRLGTDWLVPPAEPKTADAAQGSGAAAPGSTGESAQGSTPEERRKTFEIERRAQFIYDMTFMPVPDVVEKLTKEPRYWLQKLTSAERLVGTPWYTTFFHPKRLARRWKTLRYVLEALPDAEFKDRLTKSAAGTTLMEGKTKADWDAVVADLLRSFQTIGGASSETFARFSRGWSIVVGFLLAAALNVDSLDLLNSYLTDPALRRQVLSQSDVILQQQEADPADKKPGALAPMRAQLDTATTQLEATAKGITGALESLGPKLDADSKRTADALRERIESAVSIAQTVQKGVGEVESDLTEADQKIRGVTRSLTSSFPIGWKRFPNCRPGSPDLRCRTQKQTLVKGAEPWWYTTTVAVARVFSGSLGTSVESALMPVAAVSVNASAEYNQWLIGVILTGLLLGLGTPFWVQAVTAAFNLQRWNRQPKGEKEKKEGAAA